MSVTLKSVSNSCKMAQVLATRNQEPQWSLDKRRAGIIASRHLHKPTAKDEAWRQTNLEHFAIDSRYMYPDIDNSDLHSEVEAKIVALEDNSSEVKPLIALPMSRALQTDPSIEKFFFLNQNHVRDFYGALNAIWRNGGAWFDIPANTAVNKTIKAEHDPHDPAFFPHSVVRSNSGSKASIIEHFCGDDGERQAIATIELHLAANSSLQYGLVLDWGERTNALINVHVYLQEGSKADIFIVDIGGLDNKVFLTSDITGPNASCKVYGLTYVDEQQNFEINLLQKHHSGHSTSDVLYHCALDGQSRTVFSGNIDVCQVAQKSDAYQKNRNLLLSPKAHAYSQPQLEIVADDVRCTHGANFTSYDPEQQFYLESRGIATKDAQRLIVSGFLHEIIGHYGFEDGRRFLSSLLSVRLGEDSDSFSELWEDI